MALTGHGAELVQRALHDALGSAAGITRSTPLRPGTAQERWKLELADGQCVFAKLAAEAQKDKLEAEADGLEALARSPGFRVPRVFACVAEAGYSTLLMEFLSLRRPDAQTGRAMGKALAALHQKRGLHYGWRRNNYVGATPQSNTESDNWPLFFARERLAPQFALAATQGYRGKLQEDGERIRDKISAFFLEYSPAPSLVHGDLWSGNVGVLDSGMPALFDPAVHFGDREGDLAMSELFGGFPNSFYLAYREAAPLDDGYESRKPLYNLYHILNHLNLFGPAYLGQAERMARSLTNHLRH